MFGKQLIRIDRTSLYILVFALAASTLQAAPRFIRGDFDQNERIDLADAISTLEHVFLGRRTAGCLDAVDSNDDGSADGSDAIFTLLFLFFGHDAPLAPYPDCGEDPTEDELGCESYGSDDCPPIYELDNNVPLMANTQDVEALLENPDDRDDERINKYLFELGLATRELTHDMGFNRIILHLARESETQTANLLDLAKVAPEYYDAINATLSAKRLTIRSIANDLTHRPVAPNPEFTKTAELEKYVPAIFVPNLERADPALRPILSPNIEVNSDEDESVEDHIVAWHYSRDGTLREIILGEETSLNTTTPLFLLDNAVTTLKTEENKEALPRNPQTRSEGKIGVREAKASLSFSSYEHSIESTAYRYESSGKSEFAVNAYRIDPTGTVHWIYDSSGTKVINKIKKSQIGTTRYVWSHHASDWKPWSNPWTPNVTQYGVNMVFWNTFERDWHRSPKALGTCSANGTTIHLAGRRKYDSEWYSWIPSTTNIHYTRFQWIYSTWAHWNSSWKAKFRLWRVGN